jgi:formate-dependent nitrite reductase membrane component NrfD
MAEHFVQPPNWEWWILGYFFCAGLAGGLYTLATLLRLAGTPASARVVRTSYLWVLPLCVLCGIFLTVDLGKPLDFWHMMINTTPGEGGLNFKYWSPISLGTWGLLIFSIFAFVAFLENWRLRDSAAAGNPGMTVVHIIGSLFGIFLASYTGVVLSVSNQPVWSDSWAIGALFVASAFSGAAAVMALIERVPDPRLMTAERYFAIIEILAIVLFFWTVASAGTISKTFSGIWIVLWILVVLSLVPAFIGGGGRRAAYAGAGGATVTTATSTLAWAPIVVLIGVLLMRYIVIFSAQY